MIVRRLPRFAAVAIAVAGAVDPTLTRELPIRQPLAIVAIGDETVATARALQESFASDYDSVIRMHADPSRMAACPSAGGCVIVSTGAVPERVTAGAAVIGALRVPTTHARVIAGIDIPPRVHLNGASVLRVALERIVTRVEVSDEGILVGSAQPTSESSIDVPWVPLAEGARALRVIAGSDSADVSVIVDAAPTPVLFYEPEATWLGTFARRALEDDARFTVQGRAQVAPPIAIMRGAVPRLSAETLDGVGVAVVAAPDLLRSADVDLLERFITRRGGSLVVIPDRRPAGPILRLLPRIVEERQAAEPQSVGLLRATEMLVFDQAPGISNLAASDGKPIVATQAVGRGRVIVSGAMDAWRYRDGERFDAFWRNIVWDAAAAAGGALRVVTRPAMARRGDAVHIDVEVQSLDPLPEELTAEGTFDCAGERGVVRLWPGARPGTFNGVFRPSVVGRCRIDVSTSGLSATTPLLIAADIHPLLPTEDRLAAVVEAHGGVVVNAGGEAELRSRVHRLLPPRHEATPTKPMRSPLWIVPFVACLGVEWWSRRRGGLR